MPQEVDQWKEEFNLWKQSEFDPFDDDYSNAHKYGAEKARNYLIQFVITPLQSKIKELSQEIERLKSEGETYPYSKSEMNWQIIAMKSFGIKYPENGGTFEQCINGVFGLVESSKAKDQRIKELER